MKRENVKRDENAGGGHPVTFHVSRFSPPSRRSGRWTTTTHRPAAAFTLIELLVTIALGAILATVAAVSLAGTLRTARALDAAGQLANYDRLAREWARRSGQPGRLTFDLDRGTISRSPAEDAGDGDRPAALHLAAGVRVERVVWAGGSVTAGQAMLPCSTRGQMPSYGVLLAGTKGERHWLVVAGLTGRTVSVNDAREVEDLFRTLAGQNDDPPGRGSPGLGPPSLGSPGGDDAP